MAEINLTEIPILAQIAKAAMDFSNETVLFLCLVDLLECLLGIPSNIAGASLLGMGFLGLPIETAPFIVDLFLDWSFILPLVIITIQLSEWNQGKLKLGDFRAHISLAIKSIIPFILIILPFPTYGFPLYTIMVGGLMAFTRQGIVKDEPYIP